MGTLKDKTIASAFWAFLQKIGTSGFQLIVSIVLARLLMPSDFGLIGMLAVFISLSETLVQAGFSQALIQKKDADEEDFSSVFFINLVVSLSIYFILFLLAPYIASFYDQPQLTKLTRVLSLIFVINAFSYVQETRLKKSMEFKKLMTIYLPSTFISGIISIIMAYSGFGVWALVAQRLINQSLFAVQLWVRTKWKPLFIFNIEKSKELFSFGSRLMLSGVIHTITDSLYQISIGKYYNAQMLGYYENANKLTQTATNTISSVLNSVAFPAFATIQDDNERLKIGYKKVMQQVLFWLAPVLVLAAVVAEPLFLMVFGEKWLMAVPYFQVLCIAQVFSPLTSYNLNIITIKGRSDLYLKIEIIKKSFLIVGVLVCIPFGIMALVIFRLIYSITVFFINSSYSGKFIGYSTFNQIKDILPIIILSALMGGVVFMSKTLLLNLSDFYFLLISAVIGFVTFYGISIIIKMEPYLDFKEIVLKKLKSRITK